MVVYHRFAKCRIDGSKISINLTTVIQHVTIVVVSVSREFMLCPAPMYSQRLNRCLHIAYARCGAGLRNWEQSSCLNAKGNTPGPSMVAEWRTGLTRTTIRSAISCSIRSYSSLASRAMSTSAETREGRDPQVPALAASADFSLPHCVAVASFWATSDGSVCRKTLPPWRFSSAMAWSAWSNCTTATMAELFGVRLAPSSLR
jgi:hypothetical protein